MKDEEFEEQNPIIGKQWECPKCGKKSVTNYEGQSYCSNCGWFDA